jgi:molybdate-binding protein/DNA-binding XRE family transcriptional regulator
MAQHFPPNRVRWYRQQREWSQAELANRARISRTAVSAIEVNRLVPSVQTGLALAGVFGCTVEDLFGTRTPAGSEVGWAWSSGTRPIRFWQAAIQGKVLWYPAETTAAGVIAHDGVAPGRTIKENPAIDPNTTLVLAGCDPAAGLLAAAYGQNKSFRLLPLARSSRQALGLLGQGLVHVAGIHFATRGRPDGNAQAVRAGPGPGHCMLRLARWQEGLALAPRLGRPSIAAIVRSRLRWIGREPGAAARQCMDELLPARRQPRRLAGDHKGVADAIRLGWADVGVCHRLVSEEAGLGFRSIREEFFDLCYPEAMANDPRIRHLIQVVRSDSYRCLLGDLPGYDAHDTGEIGSVS